MSSLSDVDDGVAPSRTEATASSARTAPLDATVSDRWWWWITAVPIYAAVVFAVTTVVAAAIVLVVLPNLALAVAFPLALYVDARAVNDADIGWSPDSVLTGSSAWSAPCSRPSFSPSLSCFTT